MNIWDVCAGRHIYGYEYRVFLMHKNYIKIYFIKLKKKNNNNNAQIILILTNCIATLVLFVYIQDHRLLVCVYL